MSKVKPGAGRKMWIKALRSGKYKQGTGRLKNGEEYCCLGVACDVFSHAKSRGGEFDCDGCHFKIGDGNYQQQSSVVNKKVADWVGITADQVEELVNMNDGDQNDFNQIADYVESLPIPTSLA